MPSTYKTPGVYVEEISTLPASIAQVETAIPAFVGFTKDAKKDGKLLNNVPTRITSLLEYEKYFEKGPNDLAVSVNLNTDNSVQNVAFTPSFCLYDSLRMFYDNGGGPCYIVSVGNYDPIDAAAAFTSLETGLAALRKEDEPTLILFPDAVKIAGATDAQLGSLQKKALKQCNDLQDRFCIFDLLNGGDEITATSTPILKFRNNIGVQYLKYGASYYPELRTTLSFDFGYENIKDSITKNNNPVSLNSLSTDATIVEHYDAVLTDQAAFSTLYDTPVDHGDFPAEFATTVVEDYNVEEGFDRIVELSATKDRKAELIQKARYIKYMIEAYVKLNPALADTQDEDTTDTSDNDLKNIHDDTIAIAGGPNYGKLETYVRRLYDLDISYTTNDGGAYAALGILEKDGGGGDNVTIGTAVISLAGISPNTEVYGDAEGTVKNAVNAARPAFQALYEDVLSYLKSFMAEIETRVGSLESLLQDTNPTYANIVNAVKKEGVVLPPSGAIAGVYAATDNERGVWVAPANRSLNSVIGPKINITSDEQGGLNVDPVAGKSINAIRAFSGKGTLVWGARTLNGNSNEWRYIPVRRLFNMVEESVKNATEFVVFEPNDKNTWVRTKAMIENFLNQIWKAGGLAGSKAEEAYIVKIGLGETMTAQDILEGRMIVEIHMAAVRPAEFIILRFMHKLQES